MKIFLIVLLVLAISFSPRISVGMLEGNRFLDLRFEDFILVLIGILWLVDLVAKKEKIFFPPIFKAILIYISLAALSTFLGVLQGWIDPVKSTFFYLKEIEYFFICIVVANFIKNYKDFEVIVYSLVTCVITNGIYIFFQIILNRMPNYYVGTIGEPSKFITGGYFAISLILSAVIFLMVEKPKLKYISLVSLVLCILGLMGSISRANIFGVLFSFLFLVFFIIRELVKGNRIVFISPRYILAGILIFFALSSAFLKLKTMSYIDVGSAKEYLLNSRVNTIYIPLLAEFKKSPILGFGKTGCSIIVPGTGEAHNHYLRILFEMGIIGLVAFLYLIFSIIKMYLKAYNISQFKPGKAVALSCLLVIFTLMVASFTQDAFLPVKVNETFWLLVGLTASVYRLNTENSKVL